MRVRSSKCSTWKGGKPNTIRSQSSWRRESVNALGRGCDHLPLYEPNPYMDIETTCLSFYVACIPCIYPNGKASDILSQTPSNADEWAMSRSKMLLPLVAPAGIKDGRWWRDEVPDAAYLSRQIVRILNVDSGKLIVIRQSSLDQGRAEACLGFDYHR